MSKRLSGPPRRPRNPVARAVRTPQFRQRVERDRRQPPPLPSRQTIEAELKSDAGPQDDEEKEPEPRA